MKPIADFRLNLDSIKLSVSKGESGGAFIGSFILDAAVVSGAGSGVAGTVEQLELRGSIAAEEFLAKGLSNAEVRAWYSPRARAIDTSGPPTLETAARVHGARNALKVEARAMMSDRAAAAELDRTDPITPLEFYTEKYSKQGYSGESLWRRIIQGGTTPNEKVNKKYGIE